MATTSPPTAPKKKSKPAPPADAFWQRYSPHFEFPLSAVASVALHILAIALLIFIALGFLSFNRNKPLEMAGTVAIIDDSPGDPNAGGNSPAPPQENVSQPQEAPKVEVQPDVKVDVKVAPQETITVDTNTRFVEDPEAKAVRQAVSSNLDKLLQGSGQPNASGSGNGTGEGNGNGNGPGTQRGKRAARWVISFNTRDGRDYLQQLAGLQAIVAVPAGNNQYQLFRNLSSTPVVGQIEDVSKLDRIYWVDGNAQSVTSLAQAMGIPVPEAIVAFFPKSLEEDLIRKEEAYWRSRRHGQAFNENRVAETRYQVLPRGGVYELRIVDMKFQ